MELEIIGPYAIVCLLEMFVYTIRHWYDTIAGRVQFVI